VQQHVTCSGVHVRRWTGKGFAVTATFHTQTLNLAREVAHDAIAPDADSVDQEARWPEPGLRALQAAGLGGLVAPASSGGLGFGLLSLAQTCEVIGQHCASTALCFGMHCVGTAVIAAKATNDQHKRYLDPISQGKHLTTIALSEPGTGAHFYLPQTKLDKLSPDFYQVTGEKSFVTNGGYADSYVVSTAAAEPGAAPDQFSCVVVPEGIDGLNWGDAWDGFGMRGNASRMMFLKDVSVPREDLLGEEGDQLWYVFEVVTPYFLMAMAGTYLGVAASAFVEAQKHLSRRRYSFSGTTLAQQPVLQHRVGMLWSQVERTRRLIYHAADEADRGGEEAILGLLAAKADAAECATNVANEAMTLMGGKAYLSGSASSRHLRDARAGHVMGPTTDILRTWSGRALLGLPLLSE
jgi:alkylation response protein AidB-like acyl-CoA dehydrogenase